MASWARGYGDFVMAPDLDTLMPVPWLPGTALCLADLQWQDGSDVVASPRQVLRRQLARLAERGWMANAGTELEFILFEDSYEQAWDKGYVGLTPANRYNVDYSMLGTARVEPLLRAIRNAMHGAGMRVEDSKGECNLGQHEINFHYSDALTHLRPPRRLQERRQGDRRPGRQGDHVHGQVRRARGQLVPPAPLAGRRDDGRQRLRRPTTRSSTRFLAGAIAGLRELTLLLAPNINSYKRFAAGSFAPTAVAWGNDNRTCALRVVGHGPGRRFECRLPGADVNPYLALAGLIAAGLHGVDAASSSCRPSARATPTPPRTSSTCRRRCARPATLFAGSAIAREALGEEVVAHYLNMADVELAAYDAAVTDWERVRGFERL